MRSLLAGISSISSTHNLLYMLDNTGQSVTVPEKLSGTVISNFLVPILFQYYPNKFAKLRRNASRVHFASNSFGPIHFVLEHFRLYTLGFEHFGRHVSHHVGHRNVVLTLCEVSETLTEWNPRV